MVSRHVPGHRYLMRLFLAGDEPNSRRANEVIQSIASQLGDWVELQTVDVFENIETALRERIVAVPALIVEASGMRRVVVGSLVEEHLLRAELGIDASESPSMEEKPSCEEPAARLALSEQILAALQAGRIDALVGKEEPLMVREKSVLDRRTRLAQEAELLANQWRATFDAVSEYIWILDLDQRIVRANLAAIREFGPLEELRGMHCWQIVHKSSKPPPECPILRMRKSLSRETMEAQVGDRWFHVSVDPILDHDGRLTEAVHILHDITEQKRLRLMLEASEERNRIISEMISDYAYTFVVGPDGTLRGEWVNDAFLHRFGYTTEELDARGGWQSMVFPEDLPAAAAHAQAVIGGRTDVCEMRFVTRTGDVRWIKDYAIPVVNAAGRVHRIHGAAQDVTDEMALKARLQAERENLKAFIDATPAAVFLVNAQRQIIQENPEARCLFGSTTEKDDPILCGDLARCVHRQDDPRGCGFGPFCLTCVINESIQQAIAGHSIRNREASLTVDKEGVASTQYFLLGAAPVSLSQGPGAALALHDITDHKIAAAERERLYAALAQSDRLASMGMLAAGVAHEINNPLSYVLYNIESTMEDLPCVIAHLKSCHETVSSLLGGHEELEKAPGLARAGIELDELDDIASRLREAAGGARRIKEISRGLGTFSRVDEQKIGPVQIHPVIEHALAMAFNQIKYRARVVKDFGTVPPVLAGEGKLAQVFLNLLINAAHAIDEGHQDQNEIRIRTWTEDGSVFAEVSDTGRGIAPEHREHIFEPFFTTKGIGAGTGLGLFISKNIITSFGGKLSFESEVGRGTRFQIELPRLPPDWFSESMRSPQREPTGSIHGRVLVIDDEEAIREAVTRMLRRDHEVVCAASGEEARAILSQDRRFDVILCDLMMPRVSGMELHAWLTEVDSLLAGRVVFITGGAFTPGASEYLIRSGNLRIEKPFDTFSFRKLVGELIVAAKSRSGERR